MAEKFPVEVHMSIEDIPEILYKKIVHEEFKNSKLSIHIIYGKAVISVFNEWADDSLEIQLIDLIFDRINYAKESHECEQEYVRSFIPIFESIIETIRTKLPLQVTE